MALQATKSSAVDRHMRVALVAGALVALVVHVLAVPGLMELIQWRIVLRPVREPEVDRTMPAPPEVPVGRDTESISTVAWIPYDDFRELMARQSRTHQPAVQREADPVPEAPMELDPTPPAPTAPPSRPTPATVDVPAPPAAQLAQAAPPLDLPVPETAGRIPPTPILPAQQQAEQTAAPANVAEPQPAGGAPARPTAAPRDDREAPPTRLTDNPIHVQPGRVIVGQGIEIKTARPDISIVALYSTVPHNPTAILTFDTDGRVVDVELTRSTGAPNYDSPVEASLYKWRATGRRVDAMTRPFEIEVTLILVDEP